MLFAGRAYLFVALTASTSLAACSGDDAGEPAPTDSGPAVDSTPGVDAKDTAVADEGADVPVDTGPFDGGVFNEKLSKTSLYADFATKKIAPTALAFAPAHQLWADGTEKQRWVQIPPGTKIDTSDMDNWIFPVGTKFWKEFDDPTTKKPLETRLIERSTATSYRMGSYIWAADGSEATYSEAGASNVNGTDHDVPDIAKCQACHNAAPGKINGFQAIQLSKPSTSSDPLNLTYLADNGFLSTPPPKGVMFPVPGNATEAAALGYMHANCGHCHNPKWEFFTITNQVLRLNVADTTVATTTTFRTTVFQPTTSFKALTYRIYPGDSAQSAIGVRPTHRGDAAQMPPIGTKHVDDAGVAAIHAWIDSMPKTDPPDAGPSDGGGD